MGEKQHSIQRDELFTILIQKHILIQYESLFRHYNIKDKRIKKKSLEIAENISRINGQPQVISQLILYFSCLKFDREIGFDELNLLFSISKASFIKWKGIINEMFEL